MDILWIPVSFPRHSCHCPVNSWTKCLCWKQWESGLSCIVDFHSQGYPSYHHYWASICLQQRSKQHTWYGTINKGYQPATTWQVDYTEPFPSWKGQHFALNKIHFYSGYVNTCKTMICCLLHCYDITHSIASDQGTYFTTSKVLQSFKSPSIHCSNHVHYHPEAVGLKRMVE